MRAQDCPVSFVILAGYNNQDNTLAVLEQLTRELGANLLCHRNQQGLVPARSQGIKVLDNEILDFHE